MSKSKNTNPESEFVAVTVSPENYPRTMTALRDLKRIMVEEAESYTSRHSLPYQAIPPMVVALLMVTEQFAQDHIEKLRELCPEVLDTTEFEDVSAPAPPQKGGFQGH